MAGNPNLIVIAEVLGSAAKPYRASYHKESGQYLCSCPAWTRHTPRTDCKHLVRVKKAIGGEHESTYSVELTEEGQKLKAALSGILNSITGSAA